MSNESWMSLPRLMPGKDWCASILETNMVGLTRSLPRGVMPLPHNVILSEERLDHNGGSKEDVVELQTEGAKSLLDGNGLARHIRPLA